MKRDDKKHTEWSLDVKLFPLAYNYQITTTIKLSPYEKVFHQKSRKSILFTASLSKKHKVIVNQTKVQNVIIYHFTLTMKIIFIIPKFYN